MTITEDVYFRAETVPPNLHALGEKLRTFYNLPAINVGYKGDTAHTRGYHRSRNFILNSPYCPDRHYSVSEVGNGGGDANAVSAMDITLPAAQLLPFCKRLDVAVRSGKFEKIAEWYGNKDGDQIVDGYDNIHNAVSSSDSSHLWHAHLSFIRSHANDNHDDVYAMLTGTGNASGSDGVEMDANTPIPIPSGIPAYLGSTTQPTAGWLWHAIYYHLLGNEQAVKDLKASIDHLASVIAAASKSK